MLRRNSNLSTDKPRDGVEVPRGQSARYLCWNRCRWSRRLPYRVTDWVTQ